MKDINKPKEQLLEELAKMRERIHGLETLEKKHKIMEESLKANEEILRKSRERFRSLVEATSDWIWEVDENAVYTYVSPKIRDILGYEPEEILDKTPFSLMPPKEAKRIADIFSPIASSQKPFKELENTNLHKDGRLVVLTHDLLGGHLHRHRLLGGIDFLD